MSKLSPEAQLNLDKVRRFRFDLNTMINFERKAGKPIAKMSIEMKDEQPTLATMEDVRTVLWAGLVDEEPMLTIEDVGRMLTPDVMPGAMARIIAVINGSMPEEQGGAAEGEAKN